MDFNRSISGIGLAARFASSSSGTAYGLADASRKLRVTIASQIGENAGSGTTVCVCVCVYRGDLAEVTLTATAASQF